MYALTLRFTSMVRFCEEIYKILKKEGKQHKNKTYDEVECGCASVSGANGIASHTRVDRIVAYLRLVESQSRNA